MQLYILNNLKDFSEERLHIKFACSNFVEFADVDTKPNEGIKKKGSIWVFFWGTTFSPCFSCRSQLAINKRQRRPTLPQKSWLARCLVRLVDACPTIHIFRVKSRPVPFDREVRSS